MQRASTLENSSFNVVLLKYLWCMIAVLGHSKSICLTGSKMMSIEPVTVLLLSLSSMNATGGSATMFGWVRQVAALGVKSAFSDCILLCLHAIDWSGYMLCTLCWISWWCLVELGCCRILRWRIMHGQLCYISTLQTSPSHPLIALSSLSL